MPPKCSLLSSKQCRALIFGLQRIYFTPAVPGQMTRGPRFLGNLVFPRFEINAASSLAYIQRCVLLLHVLAQLCRFLFLIFFYLLRGLRQVVLT